MNMKICLVLQSICMNIFHKSASHDDDLSKHTSVDICSANNIVYSDNEFWIELLTSSFYE